MVVVSGGKSFRATATYFGECENSKFALKAFRFKSFALQALGAMPLQSAHVFASHIGHTGKRTLCFQVACQQAAQNMDANVLVLDLTEEGDVTKRFLKAMAQEVSVEESSTKEEDDDEEDGMVLNGTATNGTVTTTTTTTTTKGSKRKRDE